jgi:AraC-like DNA-binding protein
LKRILTAVEGGQRALHPLVERAKSVIDANYHRRISLSLIADRLHVSSNYLSRMFRRELGIPLTNYVHRVRLEHALLLLAEGGPSISEIAYRVGYQNYRDFYRNFVKYEKRSPRQARRRLRERSANPPQGGRRGRQAADSAGAV